MTGQNDKVLFEAPDSTVWMSATDAAKVLGISRQQLNKQVKDGLFPSTEKIGSGYLMNIDEVKTRANKLGRDTE